MTEEEFTGECHVCIKDRARAGDKPMELITLPITTEKLSVPIYVCSDCDGDILDLVKKTWNWSDE